jgi:hypothetical protein
MKLSTQSLKGRAEPQGSWRPRVLGRFLGPGAMKTDENNQRKMGKEIGMYRNLEQTTISSQIA